jgi:hypothetical protein
MKRATCALLTVMLAACSSSTLSAQSSTPIPTASATASASPTEEPTPTPEPTPVGTAQKRPGETLTITQGDTEILAIVVSRVQFVSSYPDRSAYPCCPDVPDPGNVYVQAFIQYTALGSGASYNPFDWQVYAGDRQLGNASAFTSNGPKPELSSGELPKGRKATGWLIYQVPKAGRITLAYLPAFASNTEPIAEYLLRAK